MCEQTRSGKATQGGRISADPRRTNNNTLMVFEGTFPLHMCYASLTATPRDRNFYLRLIGEEVEI